MLRRAGPLPSHFRISIFHFPISNFGRHGVIFSRGTRHEAQAQTGPQILQSHSRAHTLETRLGHYPHPVRRLQSLGNPRQGQSQRRNQRFRVSRFRLPHQQGLSLHARQKEHADRSQRRPRRNRPVPPRTRHRKTCRHRPRRTPAHPQRRPLLPPLVRPTHLFHAQVDMRLDRQRKEPRIARPPRRTSRRTIALHHGSRARPAPHLKTRLRPRSPRLSRLAVHDTSATPLPPPRHLLLPHPRNPRPPHRQYARRLPRPPRTQTQNQSRDQSSRRRGGPRRTL